MVKRPGKSLSGLLDAIGDAWSAKVAEFRSKAEELDQAESALYDAWPLAQEVGAEDEWRSRFNEVNALKSTIASVLSMIDGARNMLGSFAPAGSVLSGMGAAQLVLPISLGALAGLTASVAALVVAVYSAIQGWKMLRERSLIEGGMAPEDAAAAVEGSYPTKAGAPLIDNLSNIVLYGVIGLLGFLYLRSKSK